MATYDLALASFVEKFGDKAVVSAFNAYVAMRGRQVKNAVKYSAQRKAKAEEKKAENTFAKEIAVAMRTPDGVAKVKELMAARGINL